MHEFCVKVAILRVNMCPKHTYSNRTTYIIELSVNCKNQHKKNQTSCSTTIYSFELNFSKWNCMRSPSLTWSLHQRTDSYSHTNMQTTIEFFFICASLCDAKLSSLRFHFQQIFLWIIHKNCIFTINWAVCAFASQRKKNRDLHLKLLQCTRMHAK